MGLIDFSLSDVGNLFTGIREALTGEKIKDPIEVAKMELQLTALEQKLQEGQIDINKIEAQNPNVFISGWRPALGWACVFAIVYEFIVFPFILWANAIWWNVVPPPHIDYSLLGELLFAMLGLAGFRSYEKKMGVDTKTIGSK